MIELKFRVLIETARFFHAVIEKLDSSVGSSSSVLTLNGYSNFPASNIVSTGSPFERLSWQQEHDPVVQRELTLGRRIGFYRFSSELGSGNFSKVKLATHLLTKGK